MLESALQAFDDEQGPDEGRLSDAGMFLVMAQQSYLLQHRLWDRLASVRTLLGFARPPALACLPPVQTHRARISCRPDRLRAGREAPSDANAHRKT